jgi:hypothetical protein
MLRIIMKHTYCYRIKEVCINLVTCKKSILWCTARKTSKFCLLFTWFIISRKLNWPCGIIVDGHL